MVGPLGREQHSPRTRLLRPRPSKGRAGPVYDDMRLECVDKSYRREYILPTVLRSPAHGCLVPQHAGSSTVTPPQAAKFSLSFEVYPPRTPVGWERLQASVLELSTVEPSFISVTFGAGGTGEKDSLEVLRFIRDHTATSPLAHLTCLGHTRAETETLVTSLLQEGIRHFLALRGDHLPHTPLPVVEGANTAAELVDLMCSLQIWPQNLSRPRSTADLGDLSIAVAAFPNGHPESGSSRRDIDALKAKQDAGADFAITQLFFDVDDYFRFLDDCDGAGITLPILPGLLPVTSMARLKRSVELSGERWPGTLAGLLETASDDFERRQRGVDFTSRLVSALHAGGAPGVHLYAFNDHLAVLDTLARAGQLPIANPNEMLAPESFVSPEAATAPFAR